MKFGSLRLSTATQKSLVADLRQILAPQYVTRAREIATWMTTATESARWPPPIWWKISPGLRGVG